ICPRGRGCEPGAEGEEGTERCAQIHEAKPSTHTTSVVMLPSGLSSSHRYPGGRRSIANKSLNGRNCAHVEGALKRRTPLRSLSCVWWTWPQSTARTFR